MTAKSRWNDVFNPAVPEGAEGIQQYSLIDVFPAGNRFGMAQILKVRAMDILLMGAPGGAPQISWRRWMAFEARRQRGCVSPRIPSVAKNNYEEGAEKDR